MKTAKQIVLVAIVVCPDCDASIMPLLGNSYDWTPDTMGNDANPKTVVCDDCGAKLRIPTIKFS